MNIHLSMVLDSKCILDIEFAHFTFKNQNVGLQIIIRHHEAIISRNWPKCNHFICNYMQLLVICNYIWTFLQLFLMLVIFAIIVQLICYYFGVHPSMWTTFSLVFIPKKNNLCPISCKCDQFNCNSMNIQRCILWILRNIIGCIRIYKCIFWIYMNNHIRCVFKYYY
jgi:hypothetical protein